MYFSYFFRILVSGEESKCILGCILGIRGYSVRGAGDRNTGSVCYCIPLGPLGLTQLIPRAFFGAAKVKSNHAIFWGVMVGVIFPQKVRPGRCNFPRDYAYYTT